MCKFIGLNGERRLVLFNCAAWIFRETGQTKSMTLSPAVSLIRREIADDGICVLIFDRPESGANIFDASTLQDLSGHLDFIEKQTGLKGVIVTSAKKSIFIAGADLQTLLRQAQAGEMRAFIAEGQRVFNRLAALKIPTVAAIHGACAGGGYEITLACDHRVASDAPATRIGLAGNDARSGAGVGRRDAPAAIDRSGESRGSNLERQTLSRAGSSEARPGRRDRRQDKLLEAAKAALGATASGRSLSARQFGHRTCQTNRSAKSQNPAPARAAEIINQSLTGSVDESLARELDAIVELGETESTRNLIRNFFLADRYRKGTSKAPAEKFTHAAVIGAGVMGSGIAQWLSSRGISVILRDVSIERARSWPGQHRENLRGSGQARPDERGESEKGPLVHRRLGQSRTAARGADCDRGGFGKTRNQEGDFSRSRFQNRRHRHPRDQHLRAFDQRPSRPKPNIQGGLLDCIFSIRSAG